MSSLNRLSTTLLAVTCSLLVACSKSDANIETVEDPITFAPCDELPGLDCAVFDVPLIHDSTDNRRLSIDVARLSGTGVGPHEPLLINSGGPGSGIEVLQEIALDNLLPASLRERYDIIGFEQRGVAEPLRIDCDELGNAELSPYPRDQKEVQALVDDATLLADGCSAEYADRLQHVGSNAVVQDMEIMRVKLNAEKLNIIGISFGTRITTLYLERFPDSSGRIVLDAPLRPTGSLNSLLLETAAAQQASIERILNACGTTVPNCDRSAGVLTIAIEESDIGEMLAELLINYAFKGDPTEMFALIQEFGLNEENNSGEDDIADRNSSITLEKAVLCADDVDRPNTESLIGTLDSLNDTSDLFAEILLPLAATCAGWPKALNPVDNIGTTEAPASLVIGGTSDVNTPIGWATETAASIGGVFLSSEHFGHTTVLNRNNDCVGSIVIEFLIEGTLPAEGTICD